MTGNPDREDGNPHQRFDYSQLHMDAAAAIDRDAEALLLLGESRPFSPPSQEAFRSRRKPAAELDGNDLVGEPLLSISDETGQTIGRRVSEGGCYFTLEGEDYKALRRLVEKVRRSRPFKTGLSVKFLEELIFVWWRDTRKGCCLGSLSSYLLISAGSQVRLHEIIVPLTGVELERSFRFGRLVMSAIGSELFARLREDATEASPEQSTDIAKYAEQLCDQMAHETGVISQVFGEPIYAQEQALSDAFAMAEFFRFMSPAAIHWNIAFPCFPKGYYNLPQTSTIALKDGRITAITQSISGSPPFQWRLSFAELDRRMKDGFSLCQTLFSDGKLTDYQRRFRVSLSGYARAIACDDIGDKLIYAMSAIEQILLRDANEPIMAAVGDRLAFAVSADRDERQQIANNFKKAYGLRSRRVHHLATLEDEETLKVFFVNLWRFMFIAMRALHTVPTHADFLSELDARKYA